MFARQPPEERSPNVARECRDECFHGNRDYIEIQIGSTVMRMSRRSSSAYPHEVSAYIPRVELHQSTYVGGQLASEENSVLNSITIVSAPLHPPTGERPPGVGPLFPRSRSDKGPETQPQPRSRPRLRLGYTDYGRRDGSAG